MKLTEEDFTNGVYSDGEFRHNLRKGITKDEIKQILDDQYNAPLYDEFFDAVDMSDAIEIVNKWKEKAEKWDRLIQKVGNTDLLALETKEGKACLEDYLEKIQENKQLKWKLKGFENLGSFLYAKESEYLNLKQKLEEIKNASRKWQLAELDEILSPQEKK